MDNQGIVLSEEGDEGGVAGVAGQMMKACQAQEKKARAKKLKLCSLKLLEETIKLGIGKT